uniref:E3 ubiquitin-protein ligase Topors n=1 Tax=Esox lucius TaxID=8010 RepID=A0A3P8ZJG1_ESOLU
MMAPTKMKLRVRRRETGAGAGGEQDEQEETPKTPSSRSVSAEASPDSKCPICLDRFNNMSYLDRCLHRFCFRCIQEWSNSKAECPLCKQPFSSILHSVRAQDDFKEFTLRPPPAPGENGTVMIAATEAAAAALVTARAGGNHGERRRIGVRVRGNLAGGERPRDITASFYQRNPAALQRIHPWLQVRLLNYTSDELRPFLLARTDHFLHELVSTQHALTPAQVHHTPAGSDTDDSVIAISEEEVFVDRERRPVSGAESSALSQSAWDDETPGPSYSTRGEEGGAEEEGGDECMIVGFVKPMAERTPELVQLSSDSSDQEEDAQKKKEEEEERMEKKQAFSLPALPPLCIDIPPLSIPVPPPSPSKHTHTEGKEVVGETEQGAEGSHHGPLVEGRRECPRSGPSGSRSRSRQRSITSVVFVFPPPSETRPRSRSPSIEIIYEGTAEPVASSPRPQRDHKRKHRRKQRHSTRRHSPVIITIDSDSDRAPPTTRPGDDRALDLTDRDALAFPGRDLPAAGLPLGDHSLDMGVDISDLAVDILDRSLTALDQSSDNGFDVDRAVDDGGDDVPVHAKNLTRTSAGHTVTRNLNVGDAGHVRPQVNRVDPDVSTSVTSDSLLYRSHRNVLIVLYRSQRNVLIVLYRSQRNVLIVLYRSQRRVPHALMLSTAVTDNLEDSLLHKHTLEQTLFENLGMFKLYLDPLVFCRVILLLELDYK